MSLAFYMLVEGDIPWMSGGEYSAPRLLLCWVSLAGAFLRFPNSGQYYPFSLWLLLWLFGVHYTAPFGDGL